MKKNLILTIILVIITFTSSNAQRLEKIIFERWDGEKWYIYKQTLVTYEQNKIIKLDQLYDTSLNKWRNFYQNSFIKNDSYDETVIQSWSGSTWDNVNKTINYYNKFGKIDTSLFFVE